MEIRVNGTTVEVPEGYRSYKGGMYKYCEGCELPFKSYRDKAECGMHWRPKSGTKCGFPLDDGTNCPRDYFTVEWIE